MIQSGRSNPAEKYDPFVGMQANFEQILTSSPEIKANYIERFRRTFGVNYTKSLHIRKIAIGQIPIKKL